MGILVDKNGLIIREIKAVLSSAASLIRSPHSIKAYIRTIHLDPESDKYSDYIAIEFDEVQTGKTLYLSLEDIIAFLGESHSRDRLKRRIIADLL